MARFNNSMKQNLNIENHLLELIAFRSIPKVFLLLTPCKIILMLDESGASGISQIERISRKKKFL